MEQRPLRHDYTNETYRNGWRVMDFAFLSSSKVKVIAFGLKDTTSEAPLEQRYLCEREEVALTMPDGEVLYRISKIAYRKDPFDMFEAELEYVQHLTGLRVASQRDPQQHARSIEWGREHGPERYGEFTEIDPRLV